MGEHTDSVRCIPKAHQKVLAGPAEGTLKVPAGLAEGTLMVPAEPAEGVLKIPAGLAEGTLMAPAEPTEGMLKVPAGLAEGTLMVPAGPAEGSPFQAVKTRAPGDQVAWPWEDLVGGLAPFRVVSPWRA